MKTSKTQSKNIVKIADVLPYLPTQIFVGITPTEKTYTALPFIKCPKDHTWNQKLRIYKAFTDHVETVDMTQQDQPETTTTISITQHQESGITEITIVLDIVFGSHRIDKALSTYISDWSRTRIVDKIKNGDIQLNGQQMKPNTILSEGDHISICL